MLFPSHCGRLIATCFVALLVSWQFGTAFAKARDNDWNEAPVNCNDPHSLWEDYVCELESGPALQEKCLPRYIIHSGKQRSKGLIVAFHGYTACPDSFESMVEVWVPAGYDVMVPLLVGNGRESGDCANNSNTISQDFTKCVDGFRIDDLPLSRQPYIDFVDRINDIVKQEAKTRKSHRVFVAGLSQGGPAASYAVATGKGLYDASISMNSFFGFSSPGTDRDFTKCITQSLSSEDCIKSLIGDTAENSDVGLAPGNFQAFVLDTFSENLPPEGYSYQDYAVVNAIIRRTMTELAEKFDYLPDNNLKNLINEATLNWGPNCAKENLNGRGGICAFRLRNLFAAHSFAMYAHRLTGSYRSSRASVQFVSTERDGGTRNSLNVQAAQNEMRANKERVDFCINRIVPECTLDGTGNECGVPHSLLSRSEQLLAAPGSLYWEDGIQGNSTRYFQKGTRMGIDSDTFSPFTVRDDYVQLDPMTIQDPSLILPIFRGVWIRIDFDSTIGPLSPDQQVQVAQVLFDALNLESGVVIPTNLDMVPGDEFCLADEELIQDFYLEFPSDQVTNYDLNLLEELVMELGSLDEVLGTMVVLELEVAGRRPRRRADARGSSKSSSSKSSSSKSSSGKSSKATDFFNCGL